MNIIYLIEVSRKLKDQVLKWATSGWGVNGEATQAQRTSELFWMGCLP